MLIHHIRIILTSQRFKCQICNNQLCFARFCFYTTTSTISLPPRLIVFASGFVFLLKQKLSK